MKKLTDQQRSSSIGGKVMIIIASLVVLVASCGNPNFQEEASNPELIHQSMQQLTDVIVHDIFSPPQASRIYAYPSIAAYEALQSGSSEYQSLGGQLNGLGAVPQPEEDEEYCLPVAAVYAFLTTGRALIFSEDKMTAFETEMQRKMKAVGIPSAVFKRSREYGLAVSAHILAWADKDNYKETRTYSKHSILPEQEAWKPTPPAYMDGIEPHWNKIRPFALESAQQFVPSPPTPYDMDENSQFYKETMEVYEALNEDVEDRIAIASFWDCNPYVSHTQGHVMFATKKITPGGHWMGIAKLAAQKAGDDIMKTAATYAMTSIALADGFISCWDEKYRSNLIRPETVINNHIDENWKPALQTPPFPEYTSGHSVISTAAAVTLTHLYGDNFAFVDSTEIRYGLPARSFNSFYGASQEAAISRLYGGIHYRPAIDYGVDQGKKVGDFIVGKLRLREQTGMK